MSFRNKFVCNGCGIGLQEPYIKCADCTSRITLCLNCFAQGFETTSHHNNHSYEVVALDFCIIEGSWTASEEMSLLESVAECGFGNWDDIASRMRYKTAEECRDHYLNNYINNAHRSLQGVIPNTNGQSNIEKHYRMIPYKPSDDPPRPQEDCSQVVDLASYMPCRGDFNEEHDNFAEADVKDVSLDPQDTLLDQNLKIAAVEIYLSRVKERCYRKRIVRDYGLINIRKSELCEHSLSKVEKDFRDRTKPFARLQTPEDHEKFIQSLLLESYLQQEIRELQHYREAGLTLKDSAKLYQMSRQERLKYKGKGSMLNDILNLLEDKAACQSWLQRQALSQTTTVVAPFSLPSLGRKPASRLDISGTPGVEKLNDEEKELCSSLRLLPHAYLSYREILMKESKSLGSLRLAQARTLIKIDVNKTRKLYDFCVKQEWIKKCES